MIRAAISTSMRGMCKTSVCRNTALPQLRSHVRRHLTADATAATAESQQQKRLLVVSRAKFQKHYKPKPKTDPKANSGDDKPWPFWTKMAAGVALSTSVPYMFIWWISSEPSLRESQPWIDRFRFHFATEDPTIVPYTEAMNETGDDQSITTEGAQPYEGYLFPKELTYAERIQQAEIEDRDHSNVKVSVLTTAGTMVEQEVPANIHATPADVLEGIGRNDDDKTDVFVNFSTAETEDRQASDEFTLDGTSMTSMSSAGIGAIPAQTNPTAKLSQIRSPWQYEEQQQQQQQAQQIQVQQSSKNSSVDIDISRLEYTIAQLEHEMKNPTRSIDDVMAELNSAKRELRKYRWRKRLGM